MLSAIAFGLDWVHGHADLLFNALRWTGAAYLVWLGVQAWRHAGKGDGGIPHSGRTRFMRGLFVALSNPKTIVFFTAFLPQFIDPRLAAGPQLAAMCVVSVVLAGASEFRLGGRFGLGARVVLEARARENTRPAVRNRSDRRRFVAFFGPTPELTGRSRAVALIEV